jgi:MFS family permease
MSTSKSTSGIPVVAAGFLCLTVTCGIGWFVFPVYLTIIEAELNATRTQMSLAIVVWAFAGGVFSPLGGTLVDRFGPRRVMTWGTLCQFIATLLLARMTALWQLYLLFILSSIANIVNTHIPVSTAISQWFDEKRGTAMGIALLGMGLGGFIMPYLADVFLVRYGWRGGYTIFSLFLLALLIPINLWIRGKPSASDSSAGERSGGEEPGESGGLSLAESARTRTFWFLAVGDFLIATVFTAIVVHMVAFTTGVGYSQTSATRAYGTFLAVNTLGILLFGVAAEKIPLRWLMLFCYGFPALTMLLAFRIESVWVLYGFAVLFGLSGGGRSALWPLALGECFGVRHLGSILGWLNIAFMIGNILGPFLGGRIYDMTGTYRWLFILCIGISACSGLIISRIRKEYGAGGRSRLAR